MRFHILLLLLTMGSICCKHVAHTLTSSQLHQDTPQELGQHEHRRLQTVTRAALRMTLDTTSLNTVVSPTTATSLEFISRAMLVVKQFVYVRLKVYNEIANIKAPATCVDHTTPTVDTTNGIANSDLHIYVLYVTNSTWIAPATGKYCATAAGAGNLPDATLARGRPIFGRIKFNTAYNLDGYTLTNRLFADLTASALHETIHILGFDSSLYTSYLDYSTQTVYASAVQQTATGLHTGRTATKMITTPNVLAWVKSWFGCSSVSGMLVENQGTDGESTQWTSQSGSHWDRTLMYDELMTRTPLSAQRGISGLTFALLKDMGWYTVDDTFNDTSPYGYNKGCEFFNNACNSTTNFTQFCNSSQNIKSCTSQSMSKGVCQKDIYADNCGIWTGTLNCVDPDSASDSYKSVCQEAYGTNSFCIKSTIATVSVDNTLQSRCYPYTCHDNNNITFQIGANYLYCTPADAGSAKAMSGYSGTLTCPTYQSFCKLSRKVCKNWCSGRGICTRGVCNCMDGYSGEDCSITTCTSSQYYDSVSATCKTSCQDGTFANIFSRSCQSCVNCTQCHIQPTICTACAGGIQKMYLSVCYDSCPEKTFATGDNCFACSSSCYNCSASTANDCTSCTTGLYLSTPSVGTCASTCTDASYTLKDTINFKCTNNCPATLITSGSTCIMCAAGTYKIPGTQTCSTTCLGQTYPDNSTGYCSACNSLCATCNGATSSSCISCPTTGTSFNYLLLGMCVANTSCTSGTYADSTTYKCTTCPSASNCSTCANVSGTIACQSCAYGWFMTSTGTCSSTCNTNQYLYKANSTCQDCQSSCATCSSGTNNSCLTCPSSKYLLTNASGGFCLGACPSSGYYSQYSSSGKCYLCYSTCLTCSGTLRSNCITCISGMYLSGTNCYYACPLGTYRNSSNSQCTACDPTCSACIGALNSQCTKCQTNYVLDNTTCKSSCPTGQSVNTYGVCSSALRLVTVIMWFLALTM